MPQLRISSSKDKLSQHDKQTLALFVALSVERQLEQSLSTTAQYLLRTFTLENLHGKTK